MFAAAISIRPGTRACRATRAAKSVRSSAIMASSFFPTRTRIFKARSPSISTPCVSPRANSGVSKPRRAMPSTSICGTIILSRPDQPAGAPADVIAELPRLPRDDGGPVFAEPWQAQAFALAVRLSEQGYFTWKEWAAALAAELKATPDRGEPDDGSRYYPHLLAAPHRLAAAQRSP